MKKLNCWEFMKCGREPGGSKTESGVCPVASDINSNDLNGGAKGGRICWVIADMFYEQKMQCSNSQLRFPCFSCEFRYKVMMEEGLTNVCKATGEFIRLAGTLKK